MPYAAARREAAADAADAFYSDEWLAGGTERWGAAPVRQEWTVPVMTSPIRARSGGPPADAVKTAATSWKYSGPSAPGVMMQSTFASVEVVHCSTPDTQRGAGSHVNGCAVDRPGRNALEAVHRLFKAVMTM